MECKQCGLKYHHCSSCGCDGYSEYGYCSEGCMDTHTNGHMNIDRIVELIRNNGFELRNLLFNVLIGPEKYINELTDRLEWCFVNTGPRAS